MLCVDSEISLGEQLFKLPERLIFLKEEFYLFLLTSVQHIFDSICFSCLKKTLFSQSAKKSPLKHHETIVMSYARETNIIYFIICLVSLPKF